MPQPLPEKLFQCPATLGEQPFLHIQSEPPLSQFHAVLSGSVVGHQRKKISSWPSMPSSHEEAMGHNEVLFILQIISIFFPKLHRIIESFRWKNCLQNHQVQPPAWPTKFYTKPHPLVPHIHVFLKWLHKWQLPGQPIPVLWHPFSEEVLSDISSEPPLLQLETISSCPITCYLWKETNTLSVQPLFR